MCDILTIGEQDTILIGARRIHCLRMEASSSDCVKIALVGEHSLGMHRFYIGGKHNVPVMRGHKLESIAFDANGQRDVNVFVSLLGPHSWKGNQMASRYMVSLSCALLMLGTKRTGSDQFFKNFFGDVTP